MTRVRITCAQCGKQTRKDLGHVNRAKRSGKPMYCDRACYAASRRTRTPEQRAAYMLAYREARREEARQRERARRAGPEREKVLAKQRESYARNREKVNAANKAWREANPAKVRENLKRWKEENPERVMLYEAKTVLAKSMGVRWAEVPDDLALAKVELWKISRWAKQSRRDEQNEIVLPPDVPPRARGAYVRAAKLSPERRSEIARKAVTARWAAQGMSAGTAKTPKAVEGEARQPGPAKQDAPE